MSGGLACNSMNLIRPLFLQISGRVPEIALSIEREGHTHAFSCTEAGSTWVAEYVASMIRDEILSSDTCTGPRKAQ